MLGAALGTVAGRTLARAGAESRFARIHQHAGSGRRAKLYVEPANPAAADIAHLSASGTADDDRLYPYYHRTLAAAPGTRHAVFAAKPGARRACAISYFFRHGAVFDKIYKNAYEPYTSNKITMSEALEQRLLHPSKRS